jgi:hypothetical protein
MAIKVQSQAARPRDLSRAMNTTNDEHYMDSVPNIDSFAKVVNGMSSRRLIMLFNFILM